MNARPGRMPFLALFLCSVLKHFSVALSSYSAIAFPGLFRPIIRRFPYPFSITNQNGG
jgi:hypothetical protein